MNDKQLLPIKDPNLPALFAPGGLDSILSGIEDKARSITPDTSTAKGRKAIASVAARVASSKTYLDALGKDFVSDLKAQAKAVDAVRKNARDRLDALKQEVRAPLTAWEAAEQERKERHERNLERLHNFLTCSVAQPLIELRASLELADNTPTGPADWEEFSDAGMAARSRAIEHLRTVIADKNRLDAEAQELARLRAEAAARAEQDRKEAEQRAREEREARIAQEAKEAAEREAQAASKAAEAAAAAKIAEAERLAKAAAEAERKRITDEIERKRVEDAKRANNKAHKTKMNTAARDALVEASGIDKSAAAACVTAIVAGKIPGVTMNY